MAYTVETKNLIEHNGPLSHATIVGPWIYTLGTVVLTMGRERSSLMTLWPKPSNL